MKKLIDIIDTTNEENILQKMKWVEVDEITLTLTTGYQLQKYIFKLKQKNK